MEKSKSISVFIAKLKLAYPNYFKELNNKQVLEMVGLYQEMLGNYNQETLDVVAKEIIKTKKYMPSISEIIDLCEEKKLHIRNEIVEKMIDDGYFKSQIEIEKVYGWLEEGIIPKWFKQDMMKYYNKMIENKTLMIGD